MKIRQLIYFVSAVRLGSLSAVAKEQGISVQAVSKACSQLEAELGQKLLVREHDGVRPTPFGTEFFERARLAVERFELIESYAARGAAAPIVTTELGHVFIGVGMAPSAGGRRACKVISALIQKRLGVDAELALMDERAALERLREGSLSAAVVVGLCPDEGVEQLRLGTISMLALVARDHPLAQLRTLAPRDLAPYPIAASPNYPAYCEGVRRALGRYGVQPSFALSETGVGDPPSGQVVTLSADAPLYALMHPMSAARRMDESTPLVIPVSIVISSDAPAPFKDFVRYVTDRGIMRLLLSGGARERSGSARR